MTITYLPQAGYETMAWKNGTGSTDEICLRPPGASRDQFDLRVSRAKISSAGAFSAFPGVDRTITLIEGDGLRLDFSDRVVDLKLLRPHVFDSELTPSGIPSGGPVRVLNVMAARDVWRLEPATILSAQSELQPTTDGMLVVFVIRGTATVRDPEGTVLLDSGDTALLDAPTHLSPSEDAAVLCVPIRPVDA